MPVEAVPIIEVERTISRPIAMSVVRDLFSRWGYNGDQVKVIMFGSTESIPLNKSTLQDEGKVQRLFNDDTVKIEVDENYVDYGAPYQPYKDIEMPYIFLDSALGIKVRPVVREVQCEISITLNAKSRVQADQIRRKMQAEMRAYSQYQEHIVQYHYQIRPEVVKILYRLWENRDKVSSYHDTFAEWFNKCIESRITMISNQGGKGQHLAMRETQVSLMGWYDFSDPPKKEQEETGMIHAYTFTYKYTYMRPEHLVMEYPIAIHNQMIPDILIDKDKLPDASQFYGYTGMTNADAYQLNYFHNEQYLISRLNGVKIPYYDDWQGYKPSRSFNLVLQALVQLDPDNRALIMKLDDMGSWRLSESALRYIKARGNRNFSPYRGIFYITLHIWDKVVDLSLMNIDNDLNITYSGGLSLRNNHHFVVSLLTDPSRLVDDGLTDLLKEGSLAQDYLEIILPGSKAKTTLNNDGSMSRDTWQKAVNLILRLGANQSRDRLYSSIIAYHAKDLP